MKNVLLLTNMMLLTNTVNTVFNSFNIHCLTLSFPALKAMDDFKHSLTLTLSDTLTPSHANLSAKKKKRKKKALWPKTLPDRRTDESVRDHLSLTATLPGSVVPVNVALICLCIMQHRLISYTCNCDTVHWRSSVLTRVIFKCWQQLSFLYVGRLVGWGGHAGTMEGAFA